MSSNVYFIPCGPQAHDADLSTIALKLLQTIQEREHVELESYVPLKVHFGESMNRTYLKPETYAGIIGYLQGLGIRTAYIESSVLYGGRRFIKEKHLKLAEEHGFTQLPVIIADGEDGNETEEVPIHQKHIAYAGLAKELAACSQVLVLSHFKGHSLAGFGGAIKQLSMGFASRRGKLAMHVGIKPRIRNSKCKRCKMCMNRCNAGAITIGDKCSIDHEKCVGCGACYSICPQHAISLFSFGNLKNVIFGRRAFRERLVEYAYASHTGRKNIYISFAVNVTRGCDCEPRPMMRCTDDIGVFASLDPVAIDQACWDAVAKAGKKFKGIEQLAYAEKIGFGSRTYELVQLD